MNAVSEVAAAGPVAWPSGYRAAVCLSFDLDAESPVLAYGSENSSRLSLMSHQAYGPLCGLPRLLSVLKRRQVWATFFVPGFTALRYPAAVAEIVAEGHEVAHHGFMHEGVHGTSEAVERSYLERGLDALLRTTGQQPVGYRAPDWELNFRSPGLLADYGFHYESSLFDADVPYELKAGGGRSVVELPVSWALEDGGQYGFVPVLAPAGRIENPLTVFEMWAHELDAIRDAEACAVLTMHPFLSGRPGRAVIVERLIRRLQDQGDVWIATCAEVAAHVRTLGLPPRAITQAIAAP